MTEIRERPSPILKMSMAAPLGGDTGSPEEPTTFLEDVDGGALGDNDGDPAELITYLGDVDGGPPGPRGGSGLHPRFEKCVVTCMGSIDKRNSAD
jgi:hypothetical protein